MKIVILGPLPGPNTGASLITSDVSAVLKSHPKNELRYIDSNLSKTSKDFGVFSISKVFKVITVLFRIIFINNSRVYFVLSLNKKGFIRDILYILFLGFKSNDIIFHLHHNPSGRSLLRSYILSRIFFGRDCIVLGQDVLKKLEKSRSNFRHLYLIPNGFHKVSYLSNSHKRIVFVSRLDKSKGIEIVLDIFKTLQLEEPNIWSLDVYGPIGDFNFAAHDLYESCYKGELKPSEVQKTMSDYSYFLYPTTYDSYPMVLLEALSVGMKIISCDVGNIKDILGKEGHICSHTNFKQEAVKILLNDSFDSHKEIKEMAESRLLSYEKSILKISKAVMQC